MIRILREKRLEFFYFYLFIIIIFFLGMQEEKKLQRSNYPYDRRCHSVEDQHKTFAYVRASTRW